MRIGKKELVVASIALGGLVAAAAPARAEDTVIVTVPFDFVAGSTQFTAGKYEVRKLDDPSVMSIRSVDRLQSAFVLTQEGSVPNGSSDPELVFDKYETEYRLATVSFGDIARELPGSHAPKEERVAQAAIRP
jgi:hypothetical protein